MLDDQTIDELVFACLTSKDPVAPLEAPFKELPLEVGVEAYKVLTDKFIESKQRNYFFYIKSDFERNHARREYAIREALDYVSSASQPTDAE